MMDDQDLIHFLEDNNITFQRVDHPAVFTVEQADIYTADTPGAGTKNLFLCDEKKANYILLMVQKHMDVDIRSLDKTLGLRKLHFGSETKLQELLGVTAGSVTVLGLINDINHKVALYVDEQLWQEESLQCHPLVNTATLTLPVKDLEKFFMLTGHPVHLIKVPQKR